MYEKELGGIQSWIISQPIQAEKERYLRENCYEKIRRKDLQKNANIISSHHFFEVKIQGTSVRLRLQCRLIPHGNHYDEKNDIRTDEITAQFPVIRFLLMHAAIQ